MKILIAYDGSSCADAALEDLKRAGLPTDAEVLLMSVAEQWFPPPPPSSYEIVESAFVWSAAPGAEKQMSQAVEQAQTTAFQASRIVQSNFPNWKIRAEGYCGSPASEIIDRAEEWGADLIVVGACGHSGFSRFIFGSVSQSVVTEAPCSIRVSRSCESKKEHHARIIIGLDGSSCSRVAVKTVAARAWPKGSEVRLVTSVDPWHMYALEPADKYAGAKGIQQAAEAELRAAGLQVSSVIKEENPRHLLVAEAERWKADSIFVGARGLGRLGRLLLGSVSAAVVSRAHCSVEVVRSPAGKK